MRTAFIDQLICEAGRHDNVFLVVGDLGFSVIEPFAERFPDRYLNAGIAEQNMTGVAAGLAMEGYNVYVYSIGNFPTLRCMEQIRYDVAYHNLSVKIVAVGGGYAYGSLGASHHATEELGMIRTIPNMIVCAPGDPAEARAVTTYSANHPNPMYIRLGKAGEPLVHSFPLNLDTGEIVVVRETDSPVAILSTGAMLDYTVRFVYDNNIDCSIYSFPFIKPMDPVRLQHIACKYKKLITIEEHQLSSGFGSAILERINDMFVRQDITTIPIIERKAIPDQFFSVSGTQQYIRELVGIKLEKSDFL